MFWDNLCVACHNKKITPTALSKELSISSSSVTARHFQREHNII